MKSVTPVAADAYVVSADDLSLEEEGRESIPEEEAPTRDNEQPPLQQHQQAHLMTGTIYNPPNTPAGGVWGKQRFRGRLTAAATVGGVLVAFIPGLIMLAFRLDEREAYLASDGNLYDASGKLLGNAKTLKFVPEKPKHAVPAAAHVQVQ